MTSLCLQENPELPFDVLLTSYDLAMVDVAFLSCFRWHYSIIDEAQRLKNSSAVSLHLSPEKLDVHSPIVLCNGMHFGFCNINNWCLKAFLTTCIRCVFEVLLALPLEIHN